MIGKSTLTKTIFVGLFVLLLSGCSTFQVTKPTTAAQGASDFTFGGTDLQGPLIIKVQFNQAVDSGTVIPGKTLILDTQIRDPQNGQLTRKEIDGTVQWNGDQEFTYTTTKIRKDLPFQGGPDVGFTLTLIGTDKGNGVVKAKDGTLLDGDKDGTAGGDYKRQFLLPG